MRYGRRGWSALVALTLVATCVAPASGAAPKAVIKVPAYAQKDQEFWINFVGSVSDKPVSIELASGPEAVDPAILYNKDGLPIYGIAACTTPGEYVFVVVAEGTPEGAKEPVRRYAFGKVIVQPATPPPPPPVPVPPVPTPPVPVPPGPTPIPPPPPGPGPTPGPAGPARYILAYATGDDMPVAQINILYSQPVRDYLTAHALKDGDGRPAWRVWDKDVNVQFESATWQAAWKAVRPKLGETDADYPKLIVIPGDDPARAVVAPLPGDVATTLSTLETYGGK